MLVGKTNCDEFAMGSSNENSAYGPVHNLGRVHRAGRLVRRLVGGRGGGEMYFALGTDTGGSIRQPASLSGWWA